MPRAHRDNRRTPPLRIGLLGPLQVEVAGRLLAPRDWDRRQTQTLLKLLLIAPGRYLASDEIIEYIWPDLAPRAAATSLRAAVSKLRKVLEPKLRHGRESCFIVTEAGRYAFSREAPCVMDTDEVESDLRRARDSLSKEQRRAALAHAGAALGRFRGEYLADESAEWAQVPRTHWQQRRQELLLVSADAHTALGQYTAAVNHCRLVLDHEPGHEAAWRRRMLCAYLSGHQNDAAAAYEQCCAALADLGVEPAEETQRLFEQIRARRVPGIDKTIRVPVAATKTHRAAHSLGRLEFVGREDETAQVLAALEAVAQGQGAAVAIGGEPGIGKTRLAEEILFHARDRGWLSAGGACHAGAPPYEPLAQIFRQLLKGPARTSLEAAPPVWRGALARLLPELDQIGVSAPAGAEERERLWQTLALLLASVSTQAPLALLVDDAQWIDEETLAMLIALTRQMARERVLLLVTFRREEAASQPRLTQWLESFARRPSRVLSLSYLDPAAVAELFRGAAAGAALGKPMQALAVQVHARTQGNPLFVVETLQALFERGVLTVNRQGKWRTATTEAVSAVELPVGVRQVIAARVMRLGEAPRAALEALCPLNRAFGASLLAALCPQPPTPALLEELLRHRFLAEDAQRPGIYRFAHDNIRETLYEGLGNVRREAAHRRLARALDVDRASGATAQELAQHYLAGGEWQRALPHLVRAVDAARSAFSYDHAATLARTALDLLDRHGASLPPDETARERLRVLRLLDRVLHEQGRYKQREPVVAERIRLARELDNRGELADATLALADLRATQQDWPAAIEFIEQAFAFYREANDAEGMAHAQRDLGYVHWRCARLEEALAAAREAVRLHEAAGNLRGVAGDLHNLAQVHAARGDYDEGYAYCKRARLLWEQLGERNEGARVLTVLSRLNRLRGDLDAALVAVQEGLALHRETGDRYGEIHFLLDAASLRQLKGELAAAFEDYTRALVIARNMGGSRLEGNALRGMGLVHEQAGRHGEALDCLREAATRLADAGDLVAWAEVCAQLGDLSLRTPGEGEKALPYYETALTFHREQGQREAVRALLNRLGYACWSNGRLRAAQDYYEQALAEARDRGHLAGAGATLAALGVVCRDAGSFEDARRLSEEALTIARTLKDGPAEGHVLASLAQIHAGLGEFESAEAAAHAALEIRKRSEAVDPAAAAWAHVRLAEILARRDAPEEARLHYEAALGLATGASDAALHERLNPLRGRSHA